MLFVVPYGRIFRWSGGKVRQGVNNEDELHVHCVLSNREPWFDQSQTMSSSYLFDSTYVLWVFVCVPSYVLFQPHVALSTRDFASKGSHEAIP